MKEIWKDIPNYEGYYQVSKRKKNTNKRLQVEVCVMKQRKEQWKPRVNCFLKDMTPISPENIPVPENHLVYRILTKINQERLQHD